MQNGRHSSKFVSCKKVTFCEGINTKHTTLLMHMKWYSHKPPGSGEEKHLHKISKYVCSFGK
jgi:hypothetical protein